MQRSGSRVLGAVYPDEPRIYGVRQGPDPDPEFSRQRGVGWAQWDSGTMLTQSHHPKVLSDFQFPILALRKHLNHASIPFSLARLLPGPIRIQPELSRQPNGW